MENPRGLSIHITAFAAFSAICYFGAKVLVTIVLAILMAYLLDPVVNLLQRIRIPRSIAIFFSMAVATILIAATVMLFLDRVQEFSDNLPRYRSKIQAVTGNISRRIRAFEKRSEDLTKTIIPKTATSDQKPMLVQQYSGWSDYLRSGFSAYIFQISFFPFLLYFLLMEKDTIRLFVTNLIRGHTMTLTNTMVENTAARVVNDVNRRIRGFVVGYLVSTILLFVCTWVIFLAFQVEEALIWAILFALLNVIPFLGAIFSIIPPILIAVLQFTSIQKTLLLVGICLGIHIIYANYLIPRTTGRRTKLSPLVVLMAMMYWGFLWGPIGIFLAIPLTASLRSIWNQYRNLPLLEQKTRVAESA
jgi:predicted PurR-regulated permease PerM